MLKGRLLAIYDQIEPCECLADIGTDHGYIPIYCVKNELAKKAFAVDIRPGPIVVAAGNIKKFGLEDRIRTVVSDGFKGLAGEVFDTAVIAGMGGTLISDIIREGGPLLQKCKQIVIQPMNDIEMCRKWLWENRFEITNENLAEDGRRIYGVISVRYMADDIKKYDETDILVGPYLRDGRHRLFIRYIDMLLKRRTDMLDDMLDRKIAVRSRDGADLDALTEKTKMEINILKGLKVYGSDSERGIGDHGNGGSQNGGVSMG